MLAIGELGAFAGEGQGLFFGLGERQDTRSPVAAAVLALRSQRVSKKRGREAVVLFVGFLGQRCDGRGIHGSREARGNIVGMRDIVGPQLRQPRAKQAPDHAADDSVRDDTLFRPIDCLACRETHGFLLGPIVR